uniref:Uncharacterized protein n=1 Tax=Trichobilharzia regenti TaxID=157069 RepID=A0AA85IRI1_TRIRE|nr:unnamed protein product [Trichobilharzia regenti]
MIASISAEEFQRFQSQLLDLREAQITANEARLKAEKRVKQLEEELSHTKLTLVEAQSTSANRSRLEELKQENALLRDKLLSTESSFQLQSSTLRAECHRLTNELDELQQKLSQSNNKVKNSKLCQTINNNSHNTLNIQHKSIQVNCDDPDDYQIPAFLKHNIEQLEHSLETANSTHHRLKQTIEQLNSRVTLLENKLSVEISNYQNQIDQLNNEKNSLCTELHTYQEKMMQSEVLEKELRNQIDSVKRRSEKLNHELRRQLNRFLRGCNNNNSDVEAANLRKTSLHSSSSSLSSNFNVTAATTTMSGSSTSHGILPNELSSVNVMNGQLTKDPSGYSNISTPKNSFHEMPPGFFSTADFKAIIDRMSEVQEENCTLRRLKKRLEADLTAKSLVIQKELDNYLKSPSSSSSQKPTPPPPPTTPAVAYSTVVTGSTASTTTTTIGSSSSSAAAAASHYRAIRSNSHIVTSSSSPSTTTYSSTTSSSTSLVANNPFTSLTWFPFMKSTPSNSTDSSFTSSSSTSSMTLSSVNIQTVNRLKLMCEELLTENIQLKEQLQQTNQ